MAVIAYGLHSFDIQRIEARQARALEAQAAELKAQCSADKAITEGVSHDYQESLTALDSDLDAFRVRPAACIPVFTVTPAGRDAAPRPEHADPHGLPASVLYDYAGQAEKYRLQLIGCQDFVKKTWKAKAQ